MLRPLTTSQGWVEHWPGKLNNDDTVSPFNGVSVDSRVQRAIVCVVIIMTIHCRATDNPSVDCRPCHVLLERHEQCQNKQTKAFEVKIAILNPK